MSDEEAEEEEQKRIVLPRSVYYVVAPLLWLFRKIRPVTDLFVPDLRRDRVNEIVSEDERNTIERAKLQFEFFKFLATVSLLAIGLLITVTEKYLETEDKTGLLVAAFGCLVMSFMSCLAPLSQLTFAPIYFVRKRKPDVQRSKNQTGLYLFGGIIAGGLCVMLQARSNEHKRLEKKNAAAAIAPATPTEETRNKRLDSSPPLRDGDGSVIPTPNQGAKP